MALSITLNTLAWGEMLMVSPLAGGVMVPSTAFGGQRRDFHRHPWRQAVDVEFAFLADLDQVERLCCRGTKAVGAADVVGGGQGVGGGVERDVEKLTLWCSASPVAGSWLKLVPSATVMADVVNARLRAGPWRARWVWWRQAR